MAGEGRSGLSRPWTPTVGSSLLFTVPLVFLVVFFGWPLLMVVARSFTDPSPGLQNYLQVVTQPAYFRVLVYTFEVAASVTVLCLVISYPVASVMARARGRAFSLLTVIVLIPFWTSAVIRGFAWLMLMQRAGPINLVLLKWHVLDQPLQMIHTAAAVQIGMVHVLLPFMILPLVSAFRGIDKTYMQAARLLGAGPVRAFLHVYLPLSMPGVIAGCAIVFIMALGFYIIPALLGGSEDTMIAVLIEQQVDVVVNWGVASAVASILLVATVIIYTIYELVTDRYGGEGLV
jgi:putative spermidine/putrescine transport system permease protein